jgi:xanthine dehydrogenase small subunit
MRTTFLLNDQLVETGLPPSMLVLDFLRRERGLYGTREGCKEGDCGACVVLVGGYEETGLVYRTETSCLIPLGELDGRHLVTIEGLNHADGLSPVQEAIVAEGGSQCGFCTAGIAVSMTHAAMTCRGALGERDLRRALGGHLCRCTGYVSLLRAGRRLAALWDGDGAGPGSDLEPHLPDLVHRRLLPDYFTEVPRRLRDLRNETAAPQSGGEAGVAMGGGTDLYVQRGEELPDIPVRLLRRRRVAGRARRVNGHLELDAGMTFEELAGSEVVRELVPDLEDYMDLIASPQIRSRATLAGNVVNASPIGDMTILLLALGTEAILSSAGGERSLPLMDFYLGYKELAWEPGEQVAQFRIPAPGVGTRVHFEKVSKRKHLDIASVNTAIRLEMEGATMVRCGLAVGGVAPVPLYCRETSRCLEGRAVSPDTLSNALQALDRELAPISDVRGSADYKRILARRLVAAHFVELFPDLIHAEAFV